MSTRDVIGSALRGYFADSSDPKGLVERLLAKYDAEGTARLRLALASAKRGRRKLRARVAELEARLAEYERPVDEDPIAYALTGQADAERPVSVGEKYWSVDRPGAWVTVTRVWQKAGDDEPGVAFDKRERDGRGAPVTTFSALRLSLFRKLYRLDTTGPVSEDGPGMRHAVRTLTPDEDAHVVADGSDDPEHVDDCPGCETQQTGGAQ
ncbi:hypothetical protein GCM10010294_25420 [Streptomyces griseoloalbus]|uniref:hypothetical protein n=1 Tax=Streptomyces griseoloalbus TaxID=67303 RepID=UPI0018747FF0|nr:hypothetical protein GCM10010294_25420 [Streptomyces griseoloalbus]